MDAKLRHLVVQRFKLPCSVKVDTLNLVVAPPRIDRGAETPVLGLLQSSETVSEETLKTRLRGLQHRHVLDPSMNNWDACLLSHTL